MINIYTIATPLLCLCAVSSTLAQPIDPGSPAVKSIHVGNGNACATIKSGEELWCFGTNRYGVLGVGNEVFDDNYPVYHGNRYPENPDFRDYSYWTEAIQPGFAVTKFSDITVKDFQSGQKHSCILLSNGKIKCSGDRKHIGLELGEQENVANYANSPYVDLGTDTPVTQLVTGLHHTCVLISDRVKCFGDSFGYRVEASNGTLYDGDEKGEMGTNLPYLDFGPGRTVKKLAAHQYQTVALLDNGMASCFGSCQFLFDSNTVASEGIIDFGERKAIDVLAGQHTLCFVLDNQQMTCMGSNFKGHLGLGIATEDALTVDKFDNTNIGFVDFGAERSVKKATKGQYHTCAILDNDKVKCFGINVGAQLGISTSKGMYFGQSAQSMGDNLPYVDLGEGRTAKEIITKYGASCALLDNDQVKCWGPIDDAVTYPLKGVDSVSHKGESTEPVGYVAGKDLPYLYFVQPAKPLPPTNSISAGVIVGIVFGSLAGCGLLFVSWVKWTKATNSSTTKDVGSSGSDDALKSDNPMFV